MRHVFQKKALGTCEEKKFAQQLVTETAATKLGRYHYKLSFSDLPICRRFGDNPAVTSRQILPA